MEKEHIYLQDVPIATFQRPSDDEIENINYHYTFRRAFVNVDGKLIITPLFNIEYDLINEVNKQKTLKK